MLLKIKVSPCAAKNELLIMPDGTIKIKLNKPPVAGKANEELIKFLSKFYGIPKTNIKIKKGLRGRNKTIEILN